MIMSLLRRLRAAIPPLLIAAGTLSVSVTAAATEISGVYLEEMTSPELRDRIVGGATTVLIPIGGTEQNGPHMVLGKHNVRVRALAGQIAQRLGNAVVAPVVTYVPEGSISPPAAHMRFTGTISISDTAFEALLEGAARSFKQHGFHDVVFLGDHGGYQKNQARVANRLNREWGTDTRVRVHAMPQYYAAAQAPFNDLLAAKGFSAAEIGTHAGLADTALAMAVDKALVRSALLAGAPKSASIDGVYGDPRRATAELGLPGTQHIVDATVTAIREAIRTRAKP